MGYDNRKCTQEFALIVFYNLCHDNSISFLTYICYKKETNMYTCSYTCMQCERAVLQKVFFYIDIAYEKAHEQLNELEMRENDDQHKRK